MPLAGDPVYAADIQAIIDATTAKPLVRLVQSVAQTGIAHNTNVPVTFTSEEIDTHGFHDNVTNNSRITPTKAGYYNFSAGVSFGARSDWTLLYAYLRKNGSIYVGQAGRMSFATAITGTLTWSLHTEGTTDMNGTTDYVELIILGINSASATFSTSIGTGVPPMLECEFLRPI